MKKLKHLFCIALAAVVTVASLAITSMETKADGDTIITVPITVQEEYSMANEFFQLMNQKRAEAGLPEYKLDAGLMDMAMTRAAQLCIYFSHKSLYSNNQAVSDLRTGTPIEYTVGVNEDVLDGTADAASSYKVWYDSSGHRPALISTDYNYCGIGVVTYHNNIKWSLIVSKYPCGNEIESVSGSKTNTRMVRAKIRYFTRKNATAYDVGSATDPFRFTDIGSGNDGYYIQQAGMFTFKNNNPELFDIDAWGRCKAKATGNGTYTVYYKNIEVCTVNVSAECFYPQVENPTPTPSDSPNPTEIPKQTETAKPTSTPDPQPPKQTETTKPAEPPKQTESQLGTQTEPETKNPPKQTEPAKPVKPVSRKLTVKVKNVTYNGKTQKPAITVYAGKKKLSSKYYTVSYKNNKNVGYGTVIVKGKGRYGKYSGTAAFKINLKKTKLSSAKSTKKKTFTATWRKTGGNSGWQVQYSTNKKFRSGVRTVNLKSRNTKLTVRKLRSRKNYYVRIRSYKKVGRQTWYSGWSSVKKVKIK